MFVLLNTIDKVKDFVDDISSIDEAVDLVSGRYVVDAKSIMGIFSLDLTIPLEVVLREVEGDVLTLDVKNKFDKIVEKYKP